MTFDEILAQYEPRLAAAFRECIEAIKSSIVLKTVVTALERGDIEAAVRAIQVEREAFAALEIALQEAFNAGGINMVQSLPQLVAPDGTRVLFQFGVRNLMAENILRTISSAMVTNIVEDQREAIRIALQDGLSRGQNPTRTALDVIGRVNRVTGRREGGVIGLTSQQVNQVNEARAILSDPERIREYLTWDKKKKIWKAKYSKTDKRFISSIAKAMKERRALDAKKLESLITKLENSYLKLRGDTVALEETRTALFAARDVAIRQQIESGKITAQEATKHWRHSGSEHPRMQHIEMASRYKAEGVQLDQPFIAPDGTEIMYPHAPGVPARHRIGCKCRVEYDVDWIAAGLRRYRQRTAA